MFSEMKLKIQSQFKTKLEMAENKKSFIGYCDWENTFEMLTDEEAGKLIKHFFNYINDKDPQLDDRLLTMAFEPIKLQLKRDLQKYKEVKKKRSEAGRNGGLKSGETRSKTNQDEANEANASFVKQTEANEAVTVNDTVTVIDNDTVILLEKETKETEVLISDSANKIPDEPEPKKVAQKKVIDYPFPSKDFKAQWDLWKVYRKKKDKFQYFDDLSEQKALTELFNLSKSNENTALAIIRQSIDKGWKGFFELKNTTNGNNRPITNGTPNLAQARRR